SHGAVVSREYRIPAVLGTRDATTRIADGQMIEVDGDQGLVKLLE
ncbi:MAG: PEP-utilizing enzyme, partial [Anaerolineae bacterium]